MIDTVYTEYELSLKPGDKIFLYTDGITEASDTDSRMFSTDRLTMLCFEYNGNV